MKKTQDLTKGNPFSTILTYAIPVIGGNLFQLFYTLADSVIVGQALGADALALGDVHRPGVHRHRVHAQPGALGLGAGQGEQAQVIPHPDLIGLELQQAAVGGVHIQLLRGAPGQPGKGQLLPMAGAGE